MNLPSTAVTHTPFPSVRSRLGKASSQPYNFRTRAQIDLRFVLLKSRGPDLSASTKFITLTLTHPPAEGEENVRVFSLLYPYLKKTQINPSRSFRTRPPTKSRLVALESASDSLLNGINFFSLPLFLGPARRPKVVTI